MSVREYYCAWCREFHSINTGCPRGKSDFERGVVAGQNEVWQMLLYVYRIDGGMDIIGNVLKRIDEEENAEENEV